MTAQSVESVLAESFLGPALNALVADGFVTDEHDFAPYRETISQYVADIQRELSKRGFRNELASGFLKHSQAGYAYYIYDTKRFKNSSAADKAVSRWLTKRYGG